jgi:hypothetical protein
MEIFVYVNFSRDRTLHGTIRDVHREGVERLENEVSGNDNVEILYIFRGSRGKKHKRHGKKEQRVSRCKVGEKKKKTENARQDTSKRKHKRDGKNERRESGTLRWEEKKKTEPETKLLIRDGEDSEAKARSLVDHYKGIKGILTGRLKMS